MSVNTALLRFIYPADQLGRGIGINALVGSTSAAIGPSVAAGILSIASWQWLFAINVPLAPSRPGIRGAALPRTPLARHRFDWLSAMLSTATFGALIIGIDNLRRLTVSVAFELAGAAVAGALFVWRQRTAGLPDAGGRALCATGVRALGGEFDLFVHRAESDVRLAAVLPRKCARPIGGRDRTADDSLAGGGRLSPRRLQDGSSTGVIRPAFSAGSAWSH